MEISKSRFVGRGVVSSRADREGKRVGSKDVRALSEGALFSYFSS